MLVSENQTGETPEETIRYYNDLIKQGYKSLLGAFLGLLVSEAILYFGEVGGEAPVIFLMIAVIFSLRHIFQIWHAKTELEKLI
ncbi:MAG: hypothetical protein JNN15_00315 [Blastocatellia bacterium]|nr:hypothetical protein [Blastocatellia bacterium]